jgi:hypothetical protein
MAQRKPLAAQIPLPKGQLVLAERPADPRAVHREFQQCHACGTQEILTDNPTLGHGTTLIGHEDLEERALPAVRRTVVSQVDLQRANPDIGHESDHRRDRPGDHLELGNGLVQGDGTTTDLNDQLSGYRTVAVGNPPCKRTNPDSA